MCAFGGYLLTLKFLENSRGQGGDMTGDAIGGLVSLVALFVQRATSSRSPHILPGAWFRPIDFCICKLPMVS